MTGAGGVPDELVVFAESTLGGRIVGATPIRSGGSRLTWFVTARADDGHETEAVLRVEAGGAFAGTEINLVREALVYRALQDTVVPVPRVLGVAPDGAAVVLERLAGSTDLGATADERDATLCHFVDVIADLHNLDVATLALPGFARPQSPEDHARLDLQRWRSLTALTAEVDPIVSYAGGWLLGHPPSTVARTCLVQGDTGPGNFVAQGGRVTGLIDMEFAHIGDPMDDVAWMVERGFEGETTNGMGGALLARYRERTGIHVDAAAVRYYRLAVQYRCAVTTALAVARGGARGWVPYVLVNQRYVAAAADALAGLLDVDLPPSDLATPGSTPRTSWYDSLLDGIRAGVRGIEDEELREQTRNTQILVHYLRAYDRVGAAVEAADGADLTRAGLPLEPVALAVVAEEAGAGGDRTVLECLLRRAARRRALWESVLDRPRR